ncbi:MAG: TIGR03936 family radical SAM-associated protein [Clostridium sp.]|uniref:TIGR03936 family radical SAM-associated protein n=1 Tax=Clostridium sp. TaxID=1506 RepID=UPI0026737F2B|nr:TIGR03936 family radical SAM-associated protein [uncultured Clostridium sp.]
MRYLIKFSKGEGIKFISHLDLMRTIQRIIRRSGVPIEYSKGFNPHMALSLAQPLSVGVYSDGEYMDIVLTEEMKVADLLARLNEAAPPTIRFFEATPIEIVENVKRVPQAMALLDAGRYIIKLKLVNEENVEEKMASLLNENAWETLKKSKKGEKMADIKPLVKELKYWVKDGELVINALIATGSRENLSADLLARFITSKIENVNTESFVSIKREEMYVLKNNKYVPLFKAL